MSNAQSNYSVEGYLTVNAYIAATQCPKDIVCLQLHFDDNQLKVPVRYSEEQIAFQTILVSRRC